MVRLIGYLLRWLTVDYTPRPEETSFLERAQRQSIPKAEATVSVLSDRESKRFFGISLSRRRIQAVWLRIANHTDQPLWLDLFGIDPSYYTPLEAACVCHFSLGKRLVSFGALAWMFLPLVPLLPFKILGARFANRRMDAFFKAHGYHAGPIKPRGEKQGFVFTTLDEGLKNLDVKLVGVEGTYEFNFSVTVPGLVLRECLDDVTPDARASTPVDSAGLRDWIQRQPPATANRRGTVEGDPLNLVVVGDHATILQCFGARWDQAESITFKTCWKTLKAFLLDSDYRYSPVSPLFIDGRMQELALQKARGSINERIHLRLWRTPLTYQDQPVWIGQVSRDIGVRFTWKTWNLTTHRIDPDVDEARDYVANYLIAVGRAGKVGFADGVGPAEPLSPRRNLTGDPYFTDGFRAVLVLSKVRTNVSFFRWSQDKRG
jgi:hypothetical protein